MTARYVRLTRDSMQSEALRITKRIGVDFLGEHNENASLHHP